MTTDYEPLLEEAVDIAAPPSVVWRLVSDVTRMSEWSPQVVSTRLRSGFDRVDVGAQFTNKNREGDLEWITRAEVVRFTPETEIAFRIQENYAVWSFALEPAPGGGTRLVQRRETPDGISDLSLEFTEAALGGQEAFTTILRDGMRETLDRIKAECESSG